jgi:Aspartyl protease
LTCCAREESNARLNGAEEELSTVGNLHRVLCAWRCAGKVAVACALLPSASVVARAQSSIPFTVSPKTDLLELPVSTGGAEAGQFVLDTGAGITVLSQKLVDKLGGKPAGEFTGFRLTGERINLHVFVIPELRIGSVTEKNVEVAGWDGLDQFHLDGMISLDFFRNRPFTLDFKNSRFIFESPTTLARRKARATAIPVRFDDLRGMSLDLFAPFRIGSHEAECEVDTGSQGYIVAIRYMALIDITPQSPGVVAHEYTTILGNKGTRYNAPLPSITLDDRPEIGIAPAHALFEDIIYDCDVGIDFWKGRIVTFDIPRKQILVIDK